ncbi:MAG: lipid A biosynthesis acyltransferase [Myxococcales bacterium FL481]|nr:MAG: lipid A biosynthesis acyltransferase [Myxococcales bacterium FL481]
MSGDKQSTSWLSHGERGAMLGIQAAFWLATAAGRRPARALMYLVALYYRVFDGATVRASRAWLARAYGRPPTWGEVYRHILSFAHVTLDRMFLLQGKVAGLKFSRNGHHHLQRVLAEGRGAVLLGAHLGSYDALRFAGADEHVPINILGYFRNAQMISTLFQRLNPDLAARVIHLGDDPVGVMSSVRERVDRGELVALLGDRVGIGDRDKVVEAEFFGERARFPAGPFLLASLLRCPVFLVFGLYTAPDRYDLYCEPFADQLALPRAQRPQALARVVAEYAARLEAYCRQAPLNWFNFFDFWHRPDEHPVRARRPGPSPAGTASISRGVSDDREPG